MSFTKKDIEKIAILARLKLKSEELDTFTSQMNDIMGYVNTINNLNTDGLSPTSHPLPMSNVWREDIAKPWPDKKSILKNGPDHNDDFFIVPKML